MGEMKIAKVYMGSNIRTNLYANSVDQYRSLSTRLSATCKLISELRRTGLASNKLTVVELASNITK